jgi:hypothetical protein
VSFDVLLEIRKLFLVSFEYLLLKVGVNTVIFVILGINRLPDLEVLQLFL